MSPNREGLVEAAGESIQVERVEFRRGIGVGASKGDDTTVVTASWVVAGINRVTILSLYQSAVCNETKYRRLRLSCCNKLLTISQLPSSS